MRVQSLVKDAIKNSGLDKNFHQNLTSEAYTCKPLPSACPPKFSLSKNRE